MGPTAQLICCINDSQVINVRGISEVQLLMQFGASASFPGHCTATADVSALVNSFCSILRGSRSDLSFQTIHSSTCSLVDRGFGDLLYDSVSRALEVRTSQMRETFSGNGLEGFAQWSTFYGSVRQIRSALLYLEENHVKPNGLASVQDVAHRSFERSFILHPDVQPLIEESVRSALAQYKSVRSTAAVEALDCERQLSRMFELCAGSSSTAALFSEVCLSGMDQHYAALVEGVDRSHCAVYLDMCLEWLKLEHRFAEICTRGTFTDRILSHLCTIVFVPAAKQLLQLDSGLEAFLNELDCARLHLLYWMCWKVDMSDLFFESFRSTLRRMYVRSFSKWDAVECVLALGKIEDICKVLCTRAFIIPTTDNASVYVPFAPPRNPQGVCDPRAEQSGRSVIESVLNGNGFCFASIFVEAIEMEVATRTVSAPDDANLAACNGGVASSGLWRLSNLLDIVATFLPLLRTHQAFTIRYAESVVSRRLSGHYSATRDEEECFQDKLHQVCGSDVTAKLRKFVQVPLADSPASFSVTLFAGDVEWPVESHTVPPLSDVELALPDALTQAMTTFRLEYIRSNPQHRLHFSPLFGRVELDYTCGSHTGVLTVSPLQAAFLLHLGSLTTGLTLEAAAAALRVPSAVLASAAAPLLLCEDPVVLSSTGTLADDSSVSLRGLYRFGENDFLPYLPTFESRSARSEPPQAGGDENVVGLEAVIVRIAKRTRRLFVSELFSQARAELAHLCLLSEKVFHSTLNSLISRELLCRGASPEYLIYMD